MSLKVQLTIITFTYKKFYIISYLFNTNKIDNNIKKVLPSDHVLTVSSKYFLYEVNRVSFT